MKRCILLRLNRAPVICFRFSICLPPSSQPRPWNLCLKRQLMNYDRWRGTYNSHGRQKTVQKKPGQDDIDEVPRTVPSSPAAAAALYSSAAAASVRVSPKDTNNCTHASTGGETGANGDWQGEKVCQVNFLFFIIYCLHSPDLNLSACEDYARPWK